MVSVYAGTVGWGVWRSDDLGESWRFAFEGLNVECRIWSLSWHPQEPGVVWAGSDRGLLKQFPDGHAKRVPSPADDLQVWALAQAPRDPRVLIVGTNPGHLFRSDDGGGSWRELPIDLVDECLIGKPRITRIRFDPFDDDALWASAEIDAVHHSRDGGKLGDAARKDSSSPTFTTSPSSRKTAGASCWRPLRSVCISRKTMAPAGNGSGWTRRGSTPVASSRAPI